MRIIISILFVSILIPCSCMELPSPEDAYNDADIVFSGEVTNVIMNSNYYYEVTFQTIDIWKGEQQAEMIVLTEMDSAMCGYNFQLNQEYLVYGYIYTNENYTNICTRTNLLEYAIEDLEFLNPLNSCDAGYTNINGLCFHDGDINIIQMMIDNSYQSEIDLGCYEGDNYCGSPNPYMDSEDSWFWVIYDETSYEWTGNVNGVVEPLELGLQEWENGRLTSLMCGAYIYCQLSGPIPEEIVELSQIETLRLEYNYLSGFIPESICDLGADHLDYLAFDVTGNRLCPPYPDCIGTEGFWNQDTSLCSDIGDLNSDGIINVQDIIILVSFIINLDSYDYQDLIASDINYDGNMDVTDIVILVQLILNG